MKSKHDDPPRAPAEESEEWLRDRRHPRTSRRHPSRVIRRSYQPVADLDERLRRVFAIVSLPPRDWRRVLWRDARPHLRHQRSGAVARDPVHRRSDVAHLPRAASRHSSSKSTSGGSLAAWHAPGSSRTSSSGKTFTASTNRWPSGAQKREQGRGTDATEEEQRVEAARPGRVGDLPAAERQVCRLRDDRRQTEPADGRGRP